MKLGHALIVAAGAASLFFGAPAIAQPSAYTPGAYWQISGISIEDGQDENYMDFLASQWKKTQEFAKTKGYIRDYRVLLNSFPRDGEPDIYLVTVFDRLPDGKEQVARQQEYERYMQRNARQLSEESGKRVTMRHLKGDLLLQEMMLK